MHPLLKRFRDSFQQTWLPRGINALSQWSGPELMLSTADAPWVPLVLMGPKTSIRARLRSLEAEAHAMSWQVKIAGEGLGFVVRLDGADLDQVLLRPAALDEVFEAVLRRWTGPPALH